MKRSLLIALIAVEAILYSTFLLLDLLTGINTNWIKFAAILLVAFFSFQSCSMTIRAALCLTAAADVFLLMLNRWYAVGLLLFLVVQLLYSRHLHSKKILIAQTVLFIVAIVVWILSRKIEALAIGYIVIFALNLIHAGYYADQTHSRQQLLFFLGLLLFFCCDLCVGYYNIASGFLWSFARIAMWGFYLPGQVLIIISSIIAQGDHS